MSQHARGDDDAFQHKQAIGRMRRVAQKNIERKHARHAQHAQHARLVVKRTNRVEPPPLRPSRRIPQARMTKPSWALPSVNIVKRSQTLRPVKPVGQRMTVLDKIQAVHNEIWTPQYRHTVMERVPTQPPSDIHPDVRSIMETMRLSGNA